MMSDRIVKIALCTGSVDLTKNKLIGVEVEYFNRLFGYQRVYVIVETTLLLQCKTMENMFLFVSWFQFFKIKLVSFFWY